MSLMTLEAVTWHIVAFCQNLRIYNTFAFHQDIFSVTYLGRSAHTSRVKQI